MSATSAPFGVRCAAPSAAAAELDDADALFFDALCDGGLDDVTWSGADVPLPLGGEAWAACCAWSDSLTDSADASAVTPPEASPGGSHAAPSLHLSRCLDAAHGAGPCGGCAAGRHQARR